MLSRLGAKWRWYDWIFIAILVIVVVGVFQAIAPSSGLSHALHMGAHALAVGLQWIAAGLVALSGVLNQL